MKKWMLCLLPFLLCGCGNNSVSNTTSSESNHLIDIAIQKENTSDFRLYKKSTGTKGHFFSYSSLTLTDEVGNSLLGKVNDCFGPSVEKEKFDLEEDAGLSDLNRIGLSYKANGKDYTVVIPQQESNYHSFVYSFSVTYNGKERHACFVLPLESLNQDCINLSDLFKTTYESSTDYETGYTDSFVGLKD